jgi:hypothetical protein
VPQAQPRKSRPAGSVRVFGTHTVRRLVVELSKRLSYRDVARVATELTGEPFAYQHVSRLVRDNADTG